MDDATQAREAHLARIWALQAKALEHALKDNPSAAVLNVARQWLADNGTDVESLARLGHGALVREVIDALPFKAAEGDAPKDNSGDT
jgi:hypothetical protein